MRRLLLIVVALGLVVVPVAQAEPLLLAPPEIVGVPTVGRTVALADLVLEGAQPADVDVQWERSTEAGAYAPIPDAAELTYRVQPHDAGRRLRVRVMVETADGGDEAHSEPTEPIVRDAGALGSERLVLGPARETIQPGDPRLRLSRWIVVAGQPIRANGRVGSAPAEAEYELVLEPTVPRQATVRVALAVDQAGGLRGTIVPVANAIAWLEIDGLEASRLRLGVVGVRPRIDARIAATPDGRDGAGRALVRDLRLMPGSGVAPAVAGLRLTWEGILPGERAGTAVCRRSERVVSAAGGRLSGGCRTRGAWSAARWRLVYDPGTDDPGATAYLAAAGAWQRPQLRRPVGGAVPVLPRACATLRAWTSEPSRNSSRRRCPAATPRSRTSWVPAATISPSALRPSSSPARA